MLSGFLLIAVRLAAPLMIAVAIDRHLANKISYPFLWGVVMLTLVWPIVSYLIRGLA
jgi:predicted PurR-regulated permease PerM